MGFMRKALFVWTGGVSGAAGIKANSKKERTANALEKQLRLQQEMARQPAVVVTAAVAAAPLGTPGVSPPGGTEVILIAPGEKKIQVIKVVRAVTRLGLKEAKALVDGAPQPIRAGLDAERGAQLKVELERAGATVELRQHAAAKADTARDETDGSPIQPSASSTVSDLERLAALHERGMLSAEQFEAAKGKLLG